MTMLRNIKRRLFPKLVFDRTPLDNKIRDLTETVDRLSVRNKTLASLRSESETFHFKGYDIPKDLMLMTGGGPETFEDISNKHQSNLAKWIGIEPHHSVLEIGCGIGRDAIPLSKILTSGRYLGIDIIGRSIAWCKTNIGARNPNFDFVHYDVEDQLHNKTGTSNTVDIVLPVADNSVDRIFLFSVFTHLYQKDIEHYLREFRRVLKPDGLVYATTFIYDDAILESARRTNRTIFNLRFEHELYDGCRINNAEVPLGAIAFTRELWEQMLVAGGMKQAKPNLNGDWSGYHQQVDDGQDVLILCRA